ncbi:uncharacterized protein [Cherax quadricarinatus]|uniref:uncharacterized protein n=1 Tax=Cherax quadricarinatus TaxID=27406 RepID=UPI00387E6180
MHGGFGDTLTSLHQNYWVPKGRAAAKKVIKSCTVCRRYDGRTLPYPGPPLLPQERVHSDRPFEIVGIDYTGAITLKNPGDDRVGPQKAYVCLFTSGSSHPNHMLFGRRIEPFPAILSQSSKEQDYYGPDGTPINEELHRSHNSLVKILDKWNQVWHRDCLTTLREHFYGADPEANKMTLSEGDLMLVESEAPRAYWPLGLVVSTNPDKAGWLRMVKVRMNSAETIRPINRLLPL